MPKSAIKKRLLALVGVVALSIAVPTMAIAGSPPGGTRPVVPTDDSAPGADAIMEAQVPLDIAGNKILDAIQAEGYEGYTSLAVEQDQNKLVLVWKGEVAPGLSTMLEAIRKGGIGIDVQPSKYSLAEMQSAIDAIVADEQLRKVPAEERSYSFSPAPDGSHIEIATGDTGSSSLTAKTRLTDIPLVLVPGEEDVPLAGRQADTSPYFGGARIRVGATASCTSGFGATDGTHSYLLSAAHCGSNGMQVYNGAGTNIGNVAGTVGASQGSDSMMINVGSSGNRTYIGAWNGADSYVVLSKGNSLLNDMVCTSGSFSGARCSIKVTNTNTTETIGSYTVSGVVQGSRTDGTNAAGTGDSGGPVFLVVSVLNFQVSARGIISTGTTEVPCTGVTTGRKCYSQVKWIPVTKALSVFGSAFNLRFGA